MDNVEHYKLDVETLSTVHMGIMKPAEVIEIMTLLVNFQQKSSDAAVQEGST